MLIKTEAILLHHVRYSDNSLIAQFYTLDHGRMSVMVRGLSSKKGNARFSYFRPMNVFSLEIYHSEKREVHNLKEMSLAFVPRNTPADIRRSTLAMFISEVLYNIIREEDVNRRLYEFIRSSAVTLDEMQEGISNFHLWFLVAFMAYTGIGPTAATVRDSYFDMLTGQFTASQPMHPDFLEPHHAAVFNRLLQMPAMELETMHLQGEERSQLLESILRYYSLHLAGIRQFRSLTVLRELFR
ncbi:MAG: DNA repair protein RecO [Bacteroidales bacterium]|jgi:DNA repair protein RecO (recombination protein O)|nr:DNA repair protein RecO [Bacteroidales bacterium]